MPVPESGEWSWDPSLYEGSAAYYARGRVPYPAALADVIVARLEPGGRGRLLDLGCGPGSLTLLLAPYVEQVVAVDADAAMLAEGDRRARAAGIGNVTWVRARAEELAPSMGRFQLATLAQSFHWMDRDRVAALLRQLLTAGGTLAFVHATTHQGVDGTDPLPFPRVPRADVDDLVGRFLGPGRRAGQGHRPSAPIAEDERGRVEAEILSRAGFIGPTRVEVPGWVVTRDVDEVVASVFSLSYAAPHLFGDRVGDFERGLRDLLTRASPTGEFSEQIREIAVDLWEAPDRPEIVCICGSVRFAAEMAAANRALTLAGAIVVAPSAPLPAEDLEADEAITEEQTAALGALHLRKIDLADRLLVVNPGGYVGESTSREIAYAQALGKPISFTEPA